MNVLNCHKLVAQTTKIQVGNDILYHFHRKALLK